MKSKPLEVTSRLVDGDYDSFKAATNRALLGVTFVKNKRKPNIYQSRLYNQALVEELIRFAHLKLEKELGPNVLKYLKLHTSLKIDWDSDGRIKDVTDLKISVYSSIGELDLGDLVFSSSREKLIIDCFYSKVDAASPSVQSTLKELEQTMGRDNIEVNNFDFLSDEGRKKAQLMKVTKVPTVVVNKELYLENPTKSQILDRLNENLAPKISSTASVFHTEPSSKVVYESVVARIK